MITAINHPVCVLQAPGDFKALASKVKYTFICSYEPLEKLTRIFVKCDLLETRAQRRIIQKQITSVYRKAGVPVNFFTYASKGADIFHLMPN